MPWQSLKIPYYNLGAMDSPDPPCNTGLFNVHLTGGTAAIVGAGLMGPRIGRFDTLSETDQAAIEKVLPHKIWRKLD